MVKIMAQDFSRGFYKSKAWRDCRDAYIRERVMIDGGICEVCQERLGEIVHHRVKLTPENINDADVILAKDKLCYVCLECHNDIHKRDIFGGCGGEVRCIFTADGQPRDVREL